MYEEATGEAHSFMYVSLVAKEKEDRFQVRFEYKMVAN